MTDTIVLGRKPDGELSKCVAKPENRGKGNCNHIAHFDYPAEKAEERIRKDAEEILERKYARKITAALKKQTRTRQAAEFETRVQKFNTETRAAEIKRLTQEYSSQDMSFLDNFNERLREKFDEIGIEKEETAISITYKFLTSDDESAIKIREHLGDNADLETISHLLINPPRSMSRRKKSSNPISTGSSVSRIMMSSIDNNMTSGNYKLSVLYFKGKCCYCAKELNNIPGDQDKATAEHLTPVSPNKKNSIRGGTRFGNMALCCSQCNQSRGNQDLEKWMATTNRIRKGKKNSAIAQIRAFRKFAKYREFGKEFSNVIGEVVSSIEEEDARRMRELGKSYRYGTRQEFLKNLSAEALRDLRAYPNKYGD